MSLRQFGLDFTKAILCFFIAQLLALIRSYLYNVFNVAIKSFTNLLQCFQRNRLITPQFCHSVCGDTRRLAQLGFIDFLIDHIPVTTSVKSLLKVRSVSARRSPRRTVSTLLRSTSTVRCLRKRITDLIFSGLSRKAEARSLKSCSYGSSTDLPVTNSTRRTTNGS